MEELENMMAGGYLPASFLDWEGHVAAVIFTSGCNFRCPWCHNGVLVVPSSEGTLLRDIFVSIKRRAKFLDGVVISGGEPTLWPGLMPLLAKIKEFGLPVKLDTNGTSPDILRRVISEGLVECVAMDVKAPLNEASYARLTGVSVDISKVAESIRIIKESAPTHEFRTTYVPALHNADDLAAIRKDIDDDAHWVVQCFKPVGCLDEKFLEKKEVKPEEVAAMLPVGIKIRG